MLIPVGIGLGVKERLGIARPTGDVGILREENGNPTLAEGSRLADGTGTLADPGIERILADDRPIEGIEGIANDGRFTDGKPTKAVEKPLAE
ncbi:hypothetical protein MMC28_011724, partial [Mycoblastus sanguinarius]|nr:hypothetical protein [Mycoblastus sanguinarius]